MQKRTVAATLAVACASSLAWGAPGDPYRPSVRWASSWKEAVEEATARNVPIFVTFHQDG
ncbi:MAG: hypothetical protein D6731_01650 [Planctomycetota bacterium]|nr:MAG: hypothetical protein D6731_01650 [Planctomycetota bacterium]